VHKTEYTYTDERQQPLMTDQVAKGHFRRLVRERRGFEKWSLDYKWRTRAARIYLQMARGVPAEQWKGINQ
jgi:hypothetical protein